MDQHTQPESDNTRLARLLKILNSLETKIPRIILRRVDEPLPFSKCETLGTKIPRIILRRVDELMPVLKSPRIILRSVDELMPVLKSPRIILRHVDEPLPVLKCETENTNTLVAEPGIDTPCVHGHTAKIEEDLHILTSFQEIKEEIKMSPHTPEAQIDKTTWCATIVSQSSSNTTSDLETVLHSTTDTSTMTSQNSQTLSHEFQYTCDICQSCFSLASELDVHKNNIHSKNNQIENHQESCDLSGAEHNCHLDSGKGNCDLHIGKEKDSVKLGKCEGSKKINSVNVPGTDLRNDVCNEENSTRNLAQNAEQQFKPDYNPVKLKGFKVVKTCHECDGSGICINGSGSRSDTSSLDKPYVCNICGNTFSRYSGLWSHKRLHSSDKPYKCGVCGLAFARQSYLQNHSRIHTGEKPYKCSVCEKQFSQIPHLRNHERIHSGERPYQCQVCNKSFSRHSTLWNHRRIHTGEKPYECDVCGSAFNQAAHLKTHTRVHTGEKPYRCDICNLGFSDKFPMERHRAIHKKYASVKDPNVSNNSSTSDQNIVSDVDGNNDDINIKRLNLKLQYKLNGT